MKKKSYGQRTRVVGISRPEQCVSQEFILFDTDPLLALIKWIIQERLWTHGKQITKDDMTSEKIDFAQGVATCAPVRTYEQGQCQRINKNRVKNT